MSRAGSLPAETDGLANGLTGARRAGAMVAIAIATMMSVLDSTIANVALPSIAAGVGAGPAQSIWIVNGFQVAIAVALLPAAALGEIHGYRRIFGLGLLLFTLASAGCVLAETLPQIILARAAQGLGAAGILSCITALVRYIYPVHQLGRGVGTVGFIVAASASFGPTLAGGILLVGPWQWLFAINLPLGVLALAVGRWLLPATPLSRRRLDGVSALLNTAAVALFIVGAETAAAGNGALAVMELSLALAAGIALVQRERGRPAPLVPLDLLRRPLFGVSVIGSLAAFAAQAAAFLSLPFHLIGELGRSQAATGLLITPWPVGLALVSPWAGRLADRLSPAMMGCIGMLVYAVALLLLRALPADASDLDVIWRMGLCGIGFGLFQAPNNRVLMSSAPRERAGAASGMLSMARVIGQSGGATLAAFAFHLWPAGAAPVTLAAAAALAVLAALISLTRQRGLKLS